MIRLLLSAVALIWIFPLHLQAQFYLAGENPASVKWNLLTTKHFKIIHPEKLGHDARRLALSLEWAMDSISDMNHPLRKRFPVIMQNGSMLSNGFVTLAPSRMELQITPPHDLYAQHWITQLALHEFRHVAQLNKLNQGMTRVLGWFTGELAGGILSSRFPSWFYEGDAVYNETRLSESGRGRSAGFEMPLRTLLMESESIYSYDKVIFGSYRNFIPDAYIYGYQMTGYLRQQKGDQAWSGALDHLARNPYRILPVAWYLKRNYGLFKQDLYHETIDSLKALYNNTYDIPIYSNTVNKIASERKVYSDYSRALQWNHYIISYRSGLDDPGSFVATDSTGKEKRLFHTGRVVSGDADLFGSMLVWDEIDRDPRWEKRNYSVLKTYDLVTRKHRTLTKRTRYVSPDFSDDGTQIAVVENDTENRNFLAVLSAETGSPVLRIVSDGKILTQPEWVGRHEVAVITACDRGKQLEIVNTQTGLWRVLVPFTFNNISDPLHYDRFIIFRADHKGIENLFALDMITGTIYQVTGSRYGARFPSISSDRKKLIFSEYSAEGFNMAYMEINTDLWCENPVHLPHAVNFKQLPGDTVAPADIKDYKEWDHIFRFHSWIPFYTDVAAFMDDPFNTDIYPGLMLFSQNLLGTAISSISYSYQEGFHRIHPAFEWRGWYPVFRIHADIGGRVPVLSDPDEILTAGDNRIPCRFDMQAYLPLTFSRGVYTTLIRPEAGYEFVPLRHRHNGEVLKGINLFHLRFAAANYRRMALRDLYPRFGQNFTATLSYQPAESIYGLFYSVKAGFFFPGPAKHHHLVVTGGFQKQTGSEYPMPYNRIGYPRGYPNLLSDSYAGLTLSYAMPLAYPDFSLAPLLYIKRFRMTLFYDTGYGENFRILGNDMAWLHSGGAEIVSDLHAIRLIFPISAGIRLGYKSFEKKAFAEFLITINTNL